jgi:hypothetical protein
MPIGAAIGAGSSIVSGILDSKAATDAKNAQIAANQNIIGSNNAAKDASLNTNRDLYQSEVKAFQPYQSTGTDALAQLAAGTANGGVFNSTPTGQQVLAQDPGYQFRLDQGQEALLRAAAAGGGLGSGGTLKAAEGYGQDYASGEYQNAYDRYANTRQSNYNNLLNLAGMGQQANSQFANATGNYGQQFTGVTMGTAEQNAQALAGVGNAQAAGSIGGANAWSGALSGLAKSATVIPGAIPGAPQLMSASGYGAPGGSGYGSVGASGYSNPVGTPPVSTWGYPAFGQGNP